MTAAKTAALPKRGSDSHRPRQDRPQPSFQVRLQRKGIQTFVKLPQLPPRRPLLAQQLPQSHPVLLLDVRLVVLVTGARAGEGHRLLALAPIKRGSRVGPIGGCGELQSMRPDVACLRASRTGLAVVGTQTPPNRSQSASLDDGFVDSSSAPMVGKKRLLALDHLAPRPAGCLERGQFSQHLFVLSMAQAVPPRLDPSCGRRLTAQRPSHFPEMLAGMVEVQHLRGTRPTVLGQVPNPRCAVPHDRDLLRPVRPIT